MIYLFLIGLFFAVFPHSGLSDSKSEFLCQGFVLSHHLDKGLSGSEQRLVCGDTQVSDSSNEGWRTIPFPQAQFFLKNFLQDRGYLNPKFLPLNGAGGTHGSDTGTYYVDLGDITRVTHLKVHGGPEALSIQRRRKIIGEPLTPAILEVVQKWIVQQLQTFGYACPLVTTTGNPRTGEVDVTVTLGKSQNFVAVQEEPIPGLAPNVLRRYDAFRLGDPFNKDLLSITETRIMAIGVVQDIHFTTQCQDDGVYMSQRIVAGKPRFLSVGAGIDTEGILIGKASWRNSRLGPFASWTDVTLMGSAREQRLGVIMNWYPLPYSTRFSLRPLFEFKRQSELSFETGLVRAQLASGTTWDGQTLGLTFLIGPTLDLNRTFRGQGPTNSQLLSLEGKVNIKTHNFEFYQANPRSGFEATLIGDISDRNFYSQFSAQRYRLQAQGLWNLNDYDPPLLIFGVRLGLATLLTAERPGLLTQLPPNYLEYLGGSADLRGFSRKELPSGGSGALTSLFTDFEVRLGPELPLGFEPFAFVDFGILGHEPLSLKAPVYASPGLGLRWLSPIGVFRTTLAHGFAENVPGHFQFFLGYGEEF